jgi:hypothetical protein
MRCINPHAVVVVLTKEIYFYGFYELNSLLTFLKFIGHASFLLVSV